MFAGYARSWLKLCAANSSFVSGSVLPAMRSEAQFFEDVIMILEFLSWMVQAMLNFDLIFDLSGATVTVSC